MYETALDCGIGITDFWDYSIPEIIDLIQSRGRVEVVEHKRKIALSFLDYQLHRDNLNALSGSSGVLQPWDFYPELFKEDKAEYDKEQYLTEVENYKMQRKKHAAQVSKQT